MSQTHPQAAELPGHQPVRATDAPLDRVDPQVLRPLVDGRWAEVRDHARRTLPAAIFAPTDHLGTDGQRAWTREQAHALATAGTPHLGFDSRFGGQDDVGGSIIAFEMLGHGDLSLTVKTGVQWGLFGGAVQALGSERQHEELLPAVMSLDLVGCFAMTETGHGSDVQALRTTATYDPETEEFVVDTPDDHARKDYIGAAAQDARMAVVFAQLITAGTRHGVHALLVPLRDSDGDLLPGVRAQDCGRKEGLNGVDNGRLWFDGVRVPRTALLDRYGQVAADGTYSSPIADPSRRFFTMVGALVRGRASIAGGAGASARVALAIALRYGARRRQFTRPGGGDEVAVLDYRAHQRRLLPRLATSYALHFAQMQLVEDLHDVQTVGAQAGRDSVGQAQDLRQREVETRAAGLKAVTTWHASDTVTVCRESCGGAGYLSENRLAQMRGDIDVFTTFEGDNTVLLQLVAKGLLTRYRDHVGDLDTLGTLRFVASQVVDSITERTAAGPLVQRMRSGGDVRDRGWQLAMFTDRERHLLATLARRLRRPGADPFTTFNDAQPHLLAAARAHVDRLVLQAFADAVDACEDPAGKALLDRVCTLHALSTVESDRGWFLEHGRLSAAQSKAVRETVDQLCGELRPHADTLVDAFGMPDTWLDVPITRDSGAAGASPERPGRAGIPVPSTPMDRPVVPA